MIAATAAAVVLLPPPSWEFWQYALLILEFSLFAAATEALGLILALAGHAARPRTATVLAAANTVALAAALAPPASTWWAARQAGAPVSFSGYTDSLATSADREPLTLVYSSSDGEDLEMDLWRPREPADAPCPWWSTCTAAPMTGEDPALYTAMSPLHHVSPDTPPTLLIAAGHDLFLRPEDNRLLPDRLSEAGVEHRLVEIPWAEHMFDLNWGGLASRWARHELAGFLDRHTGREHTAGNDRVF